MIKYRDRGGRQRTVTLPPGHTRKSAEEERNERVRQAGLGLADGRMLVSEWADRWLELIEQRKRPNTHHRYAAALRNHVLPAFGEMRLRDVRLGVVQQWVDAATVGPGMVRLNLGVLSGMLKAAALRELCEPLSLRGIELPPVEERVHRALTFTEVEALAAATEPYYESDVWFLCITGLRCGELAALRECDVDLNQGIVRVERSWSEGRMGLTKSGKSRDVDLSIHARAALHRKRQAKLARGIDSDLVFPTLRGELQCWASWRRRVLLPAITTAKIDPLRIHDMRHTAASLMINAGLDPLYISKQLGHANVTITLTVYTKWFEHRNTEMMERFDQHYGEGTG